MWNFLKTTSKWNCKRAQTEKKYFPTCLQISMNNQKPSSQKSHNLYKTVLRGNEGKITKMDSFCSFDYYYAKKEKNWDIA